MSMLEWNETLSLNVKEIDDQHQELVRMVNYLYDSMKDGFSSTAASKLIERMKDYTIYHFSTEERYMEQYKFHDFLAHKLEHEDFCKKVVQVEEDCRAGKCAVSMEILNFLSEWLVTHIMDSDKKLGVFLNELGMV